MGRQPTYRAGAEGAVPLGRVALRAGLGALAGFVAFLVASAVIQYGFGLTSAQVFEAVADEETARILWRLVIAAMVLGGAALALLIPRRRGP